MCYAWGQKKKKKTKAMQQRRIYWEPIIAAGLLLMTILGTMVPLYMHSDNANRAQIEAIRKDIKDFHERLLEIQREKK